MYMSMGRPRTLRGLALPPQDLAFLKRQYQIAVIDDQPFAKANALRNHGFSVVELGDITSPEQVAAYPIVVCDIRGVGKALDSVLEGAHLLAEIRKSYPDKYLVSYSGAQFDLTYNEALSKVDVSVAKDASTDQWVTVLEGGLGKIGNPKERWLRFRKTLLEQNTDLHEVFLLEQSFIRSVEKRDASAMKQHHVPEEVKELVTSFARIALAQIIESLAR